MERLKVQLDFERYYVGGMVLMRKGIAAKGMWVPGQGGGTDRWQQRVDVEMQRDFCTLVHKWGKTRK